MEDVPAVFSTLPVTPVCSENESGGPDPKWRDEEQQADAESAEFAAVP
jgi:hypothetical protein